MNEIRFDKYRLLERISHGGMAEVFRAKTFGAAGFEREVAIKLLLPTVAMDREFITMLIDEAKIAGQLNHANIAQIFDLGMAEGRYYIVQEYVAGRDLRAIIRRCRSLKQPLTVAQACYVMLKVCEGLDYAHNKRDPNGQPLNLVHRDVSPQNVLLGMDGQVKLIDFGIAKAEGRATRTMAGLVKGKFAYMSPEQIRGLPVDRRSDVFACGIVFHELLTTKPLFLRKSEFETLKRARSGEILPPSDDNPEVPEELDEIVLTALARHVDDRYQSAQAMREALWEFIKSSSEFYSQTQMAEWMMDTFGTPEENTQTSVTTERDRKRQSFDDFKSEPAIDPGRTADLKRSQIKQGLDAGAAAEFSQRPPTDAAPGNGAGVRMASDFSQAEVTVPEIPRQRPGGGRMEDTTTDVDAVRNKKQPSPFAVSEGNRDVFGLQSGPPSSAAHGPFGMGSAQGSSPHNPQYAAAPPGAHRRPAPFPAQPPGMEDDDIDSATEEHPNRLRKSSGKLPLEPGTLNPDTQPPIAMDDGPAPFPQRTSRHSMRALTERRHEDDDEPKAKKKGRTNLLVAVAIFLLLLAGAASITLSLLGDDDGGDRQEEKAPEAPDSK
jgi:serine/threonine protein kinase